MQRGSTGSVVVGLDVGGTKTAATVLGDDGRFLVDRMLETPSRVNEGPPAALAAMRSAIDLALAAAGVTLHEVIAVGLDTPGPASADGVISSRGATNFPQREWWGYDIRAAAERYLERPVIYNNDGNAAALYAHEQMFAGDAAHRSSVSAIVGTGLGGGVVERGHVVRGATGMAGELGHVHIPVHAILEPGQPVPVCNCGFQGDVESIASLTGIQRNLLPYWLTRFPDHPLVGVEPLAAGKVVRDYAERGDELALSIFEQQAKAIGALFTIAANFTDPDAYLLGGGVVETAAHFRDWFLDLVRTSTQLRAEQRTISRFGLVADLDMAGARGSAVAALRAIRPLR
jgi:glucokinase